MNYKPGLTLATMPTHLKAASWLLVLVCALPAFLSRCTNHPVPAAAPVEAPRPAEGHALG